MDVVYRRGRATAAEVQEGLPDPPSYSAIRALLRVLEEKGQLRARAGRPALRVPADGGPRQGPASALRQLVQTFFEGSTAQAVAALLGEPGAKLSRRGARPAFPLIDQARKEER